MFKIHTSDGKTVNVDFSDEETRDQWIEKLKNIGYQKTITGITIIQRCNVKTKCPKCGRSVELRCSNCNNVEKNPKCNAGIQYSLTKPISFDSVKYYPEHMEANPNLKFKGCEKLICFLDNIKITLISHANQPAIRVSLNKIGKQRFNPME